jgi:hypothetical protein
MTTPTNAHREDHDYDEQDEWDPTDGHTIRRAIAEARAGITAGKKRFAARQALIDQRRTQQGDQ